MYITNQFLRLLRALSLLGALTGIFCIFILADSHLSTQTLRFPPPLDKLVHITVFGIIAFLLRFSRLTRTDYVCWLTVVAVGALDEFQQMGIVGRTASLTDLSADAIGALIAIVAFYLLAKSAFIKRYFITQP